METLNRNTWKLSTVFSGNFHRNSHLDNIGDARAIDAIILRLEDSNPWVRKNSINALGKIGDKRAIPSLISALPKATEEEKLSILEVLGEMGGASAMEPVISILKDSNQRIRSCAVAALGKIGDKRAIPSLVSELKKSDEDSQQIVADSLVKLGWQPGSGTIIEGLDKDDNSIERLITILCDTSNVEALRIAALKTLRGCHDESAIKAQIETAHSSSKPSTKLYEQIILNFIEISDIRVLDDLLKYLGEMRCGRHGEDSYGILSLKLTAAITAFHDPRSIEVLRGVLHRADFIDKDNEKKLSIMIAKELGRFPDPRSIKPLCSKLRPNFTPKEIIETLQKINHPEARQTVAKAHDFYSRSTGSTKRCGKCGQSLPHDHKLSENCPHCGAAFYVERTVRS